MRLRFVGQPFEQHQNLIDFIEHARLSRFTDLKIAVAWAKRSGLGRLWDALESFKEEGGKVTLIVGVSEGGATKEGLELALQIADYSYVFHDPRRTFHPKVYFASSDGPRSLLVGSSNLTAGGLSWNYEASIWIDWEAGEGLDVSQQVSDWFEQLMAQENSCQPLSLDLIAQMELSGDILLGSESRSRRVQKRSSDTPEDNDSKIVATISGIFKPVLEGLRKLPSLSTKLKPVASNSPLPNPVKPAEPLTKSTAARPAYAGDAPFDGYNVERRWVKTLDNTAAQQVKSAKSNPTGNLRLSQEDAPMDHKFYFREDFFGDLPWTPTEGKESEQEVIVAFRSWIDGNDLGIQELRVSHDPRRIAGQGNVPTVLHWGDLGPVLRATNYVGMHVSLERTVEGEFNLIISEDPRGDHRV